MDCQLLHPSIFTQTEYYLTELSTFLKKGTILWVSKNDDFRKILTKIEFFSPMVICVFFFKIADFLKNESFGQFLMNFMVFKVVEMQVMGRLVNNSFVPVIIVIEFKSALPHEQFLQLPILQARLPSVWDLQFLFFTKTYQNGSKKETLISRSEFAKETWTYWQKQNLKNFRQSNPIRPMVSSCLKVRHNSIKVRHTVNAHFSQFEILLLRIMSHSCGSHSAGDQVTFQN